MSIWGGHLGVVFSLLEEADICPYSLFVLYHCGVWLESILSLFRAGRKERLNYIDVSILTRSLIDTLLVPVLRSSVTIQECALHVV